MKKINPTISFIINLLIFAIFLAGLHFLVYKILPDSQKINGIIEMHLFLFFLTTFIHITLLFLLRKKPKYMGYGFTGASLIKMMICVLFLLPEILNQKPTTYSYIFQFFGLYFAYLAYEVVLITKELKKGN